MTHAAETKNMALFCDFENVALGVREANYAAVRHRQGPRAAAAQGEHRRQEGLLRLEPLQGIQGGDARGVVRADRDSARAAVGQELRRHPHGRRCAGPLLHEGARRHVRHHQRRLGLLAAGQQAAREQQDRHRRRRQELDLRPADRQLRRVHLLRRPRAREAASPAVAQPRRRQAGPGRPPRPPRLPNRPGRQGRRVGHRRRRRRRPPRPSPPATRSRRPGTWSSRPTRPWSRSAARGRRSGAR